MTFATDTAITSGESKPSADHGLTRLSDEALLTRANTASALTEVGFPVSAATLATKAVRGGGPPYYLFGRKPLYRWGDALAWAQARLSAPVSDTSQARAARPVRRPEEARAAPCVRQESDPRLLTKLGGCGTLIPQDSKPSKTIWRGRQSIGVSPTAA
jgi:hypothetical protein